MKVEVLESHFSVQLQPKLNQKKKGKKRRKKKKKNHNNLPKSNRMMYKLYLKPSTCNLIINKTSWC